MTKTKHKKSTHKPAPNHHWRRYINNSKQHPLPPKTGHFSFAQKEDILTLG